MKKCTKCSRREPTEGFYKFHLSKDGLTSACKVCTDKRNMEYYWVNREKTLKGFRLKRQENLEAVRAYDRSRYPKVREYRLRNKAKMDKYRLEYERERRNTDPVYRMRRNLRVTLNQAIKRTKSSYRPIKEKLGIDVVGLKSHLEAKFQRGMNWDNYGSKWHVDHVKALASFNLKKLSEYKKATHYSNLQPLWALDNLRKHKKLEYNPSKSARLRSK